MRLGATVGLALALVGCDRVLPLAGLAIPDADAAVQDQRPADAYPGVPDHRPDRAAPSIDGARPDALPKPDTLATCPAASCPPGQLCVAGVCRAACAEICGPSTCGGGGLCYDVSASIRVCFPPGSGVEGEVCNLADLCQSGLYCSGGACRKLCYSDDDCPGGSCGAVAGCNACVSN